MAISAGLWLSAFAAAQAQVVVTGQEVRVNPMAARSASVVLYPDTEYSRVVPQLLYPGERSGPIVLRPPGHAPRGDAVQAAPRAQHQRWLHRRRNHSRPRVLASAPPPPKPQPTPPPQQQQQTSPYLSTPDFSNVFGGQPKPAPAPQKPPAQRRQRARRRHLPNQHPPNRHLLPTPDWSSAA